MLMKSEKGMTLIEVLIALAIVGIVLSIAISLNLFGFKTEKRVSETSDIQFAVRMAASRIADTARNSASVAIVDMVVPVDGYKYIYTKDYTGYSSVNLISYPGGSEKTLATLNGGKYTLSFTPNGGILQYTVKAEKNSNVYESTTGLQIVNIKTAVATVGSTPKILRILSSASAVTSTLDLSHVEVDVGGNQITGTSALMEYNLDGESSGATGTWVTAADSNTINLVFLPEGYVWIREKANVSNMRYLAYVPARAAAPDIKISDTNDTKAVFQIDSSRIVVDNMYEYSKDGGFTWYPITSSTEVNTKNTNLNLKARIKATLTSLPSLETEDLDS